MQSIVMINVEDIETPKTKVTEDANASKESIQQLALTMREIGLLHPIGVRTSPKNPDKKEIVFGRSRLAAARSLKWEEIACIDFGDTSDEDGEIRSVTENLYRKEIPRNIKIPLMRRFAEYWFKLFPEVKNGAAGTKAAKRARAEKRGETVTPEPDTPKAVPVVDALVQATGLGKNQVKMDLQIAKAFDDEQIECLVDQGVTDKDLIAIAQATKNNPSARREVVNLTVAKLCTPQEAIQEVLGDTPDPDLAKAKEQAPKQEERKLTDEEWVNTLCADVLANLKRQDVFRRAAIYYRKSQSARMAYRKAIKGELIKAKAAGYDPCSRSAYRDTFQAHPQNWLACGTCFGNGTVDGNQCTSCRGNAFTIPVEQLK